MELDDLILKVDKIDAQVALPGGGVVRFRAENIRKERTGLHAKVMLGANSSLLAYSYFNLERDEERVRLSNSAHRSMPEALQVIYSKDQLKHDLDIFSTLIWPKWVESLTPSYVVGSTERSLPEFNLSPYIIKGGGTILFGPPERMKTMTALTMAVCIDAGVQYPWTVDQAPVLYVNLERPAGAMQRRLGDLNRALGLAPDRPIMMLNARGQSLADVEEGIARAVEREGVQVGFLDSISRAGYGDLIDNRVANQTIDIMNRLFPSWVGIAHSPRNDATHMFGSMHFEAGADVIIQLLTEMHPKKIGVGLKVVKANDMRRPDLGTLAYEFDDFGVSRIWRPTAYDFPELLTVKTDGTGGLTEEGKLYLAGAGESWANDIATALHHSRGSVAKILATSALFVISKREGHRIFYDLAPPLPTPNILRPS